METYAEATSQAVTQAENALRFLLDRRDLDYENLDPTLENLRKPSQDYILLTILTPTAKAAEDHLWEWHVRVNRRFQKHLRYFREGSGKGRHVERRKAEKQYLGFVKSSIHFYRGYLQRLASSFSGIPEIGNIAKHLHLDTLSVDSPAVVNHHQRDGLLASCFSSLMRLGDLSRYRETELEHKQRNWGPAKGHYLLGLSVNPESGAVHNQLAVMALADEDHLRAVYSLHRAASAIKPFPASRDNIRVEFEKLLKLEPEDKSAVSDMSKQTLEVLENRLLTFHANCHSQPSDFIRFNEKAEQMLQLLTLSFEEMSENSLDRFVQKMCLINIAAEFLAWQGSSTDYLAAQKPASNNSEKDTVDNMFADQQRNCQAFFLLQRFNIMTFSALLKVLSRELASVGSDAEHSTSNAAGPVPAPIARLMPHIRQYGSWLLTNISSLLRPRLPSTERCLEQFWKLYVKVLNLLMAQYSVADLPNIEYLLEEDQDTLGFAPFSHRIRDWRFNDDNNHRKVALNDLPSGERNPNMEACYRIKDFVFDGGRLTLYKDKLQIEWSPVALVGSQFEYVERPVEKVEPATEIAKPSTPFRRRGHQNTDSIGALSAGPSPQPPHPSPNGRIYRPPSASLDSKKVTSDISGISGQRAATPLEVNNTQRQALRGGPQLPTSTFNESSMLTGTPRPASSSLNVMDLVRGMSRGSADSPSPNLIPLEPRTAGPSHHASHSDVNSEFIYKSFAYQRDTPSLLRQTSQTQIPVQMPTSSGHDSREPVMSTYQSHWPYYQAPSSPWNTYLTRSTNQQNQEAPPTAPYGAIGEPRRQNPQATGGSRPG